jgi:uncharacterized protein (TIGR03435 family)
VTPLCPRHSFLAASLFAISIVAILPSACAQAPVPPPAAAAAQPTPAYDIMSIKLNKTLSSSTDIDTDDGRFSAKNVSLKSLLAQAYDIKQDLISGIPAPIESARFDIEAKVVDPDPDTIKRMTREQRRQMLLPLLTERFELKAHIEAKTLPVYELVMAKGGAKMKPSADQKDTGGGDMSINGSRTQIKIAGQKVPMASLAKALSSRVDRTVIDKTGLTGNFDLDLIWSKDESPDSGAETLPDIFTAIQEQLGLKLQPAKGPVETLIVDHAAMPSEN